MLQATVFNHELHWVCGCCGTSLGPHHSQQLVDIPVPDGSLLVQDVRARPPTSTSCFRSLPRLPLCLYLSPSLEVSHSRDVKAAKL